MVGDMLEAVALFGCVVLLDSLVGEIHLGGVLVDDLDALDLSLAHHLRHSVPLCLYRLCLAAAEE